MKIRERKRWGEEKDKGKKKMGRRKRWGEERGLKEKT